MSSARLERLHQCAAELEGSSQALESVLTEAEAADEDFLEDLDSYVFQCETCGWWCNEDERTDGDVCIDCKEDE